MLPNGLRARVDILRTPLCACWGGAIRVKYCPAGHSSRLPRPHLELLPIAVANASSSSSA
eukprot:8212581-Pyramimonas_sp.AAC.1